MQTSNFQEEAWRKFFRKDIYGLCEYNSFETADLAVTYTPVNPEAFTMIRKAHELGRESMRDQLCFNIHIESKNPEADTRAIDYTDVPLVTLPVLTTSGFCIKGSFYSAINQTTLASGWYIEKEGVNKFNLVHRSRFGKNLRVAYDSKRNMFTVQLLLNRSSAGSKPIPLFPFLKAINSSRSYADILDEFNGLGIFLKAYLANQRNQKKSDKKNSRGQNQLGEQLFVTSEPSNEECAKMVYKTMYPYNNTEHDYIGAVHNALFVNNRLGVEKDRISRFSEMCSFSIGRGLPLAEEVRVPKKFCFRKGSLLTSEMITALVQNGITEIHVLKGGKRYKLVRKEIGEDLTPEEIMLAVYYYGLYREGIGTLTDQDSASNKITRTIGTMMGDFINRKLAEMSSKIISNYTSEVIYGLARAVRPTDANSINARESIESVIFSDSQYCQREETNSLAGIQQNFKNTASSNELGKGARAYRPSQSNRLCPYTTPESGSVGINTSLTFGAGVNSEGFMTYPVYVVKNGMRTDIIKEITSVEEHDAAVAPYDADLDSPFTGEGVIRNCSLNGELVDVRRRDVRYQIKSPMQVLSPMLLMVVSANRNAGKRLTMAANALNQSPPPCKRERPWVVTGVELLLKPNVVTARDILSSVMLEFDKGPEDIPEDTVLTLLEIHDPSADKEGTAGGYGTVVTFATTCSDIPRFSYILNRLQPVTGSPTMKHQRIRFKPESRDYALDEVVVINNDTDDRAYNLQYDSIEIGKDKISTDPMKDTALAVGCNVHVLFKSQEGGVYEDAVLVRKGFAFPYGLAIGSLYRIKDTSDKNTAFTNNLTSLKNRDSASAQYLGGNGLPVIGTVLRPGQIAIGKRKNGVGGHGRDRGINKSKMIPVGQSGVVINTFMTSEQVGEDKTDIANVVLGEVRFLDVGDKVTGMHGNKGVIIKVVDDEDLPVCDGILPDIILGPLGPVARTNIGQLVEAILGATGEAKNETQFLTPFDKMTVSEMIENAESVGLKEVDVYDGRTGMKYERKSFLGTMYFLRSKHTSTSKHNGGGLSGFERNQVFGEGAKGQLQRAGELFKAALEANNAQEIIKGFNSSMSNDVNAQKQMIEHIRTGKPLDDIEGEPQGAETFLAFFRTLGLNIRVDETKNEMCPLTDEDISLLSMHHITTQMLGNMEDDVSPREFLRDTTFMKQFKQAGNADRLSRILYSSVELPEPVVMPLLCYGAAFLNMFVVSVDDKIKLMSCNTFKDLLWNNGVLADKNFRLIPSIYTQKYLRAHPEVPRVNPQSGADALMQIFKRYDLRVTITVLERIIKPTMEAREKESGIANCFKEYSAEYADLRDVNIDLAEFDKTDEDATDAVDAQSLMSDEFLQEAIKEASTDTDGNTVVAPGITSEEQPLVDANKTGEETDSSLDEILPTKLDYTIKRLLSVRATTLAFMKNHTMDEYFVHSIIIPPIGFRPDFEGSLASPIDKQLEEVIAAIRQYLINKNVDSFTNIYRRLFDMIVRNPKMSKKEKTVFEAITDHKNKNSVIRDNLCAHRIIASGRSVIALEPSLSVDECLVPFSIATTLMFEWLKADAPSYFSNLNDRLQKVYSEISSDIYKSVFDCLANDNISGFKRLLKLNTLSFSALQQLFVDCKQELIDRENYYLSIYPMLLNREPSLKKFNVQAYYGKITEEYAIKVSPLCCRGYNADFDGDQMAVFLIFLPKMVKEANEKLIAHMNLINPDNGSLMPEINQDMILGLYWMTMLPSNQLKVSKPSIVKYYDLDQDHFDCDGLTSLGVTPRTSNLKEIKIRDSFVKYKNDRFIPIWDDLDSQLITPQDFVVVKYNNYLYKSTAGRILFNSLIPDGVGFGKGEGSQGKLKYDMLISSKAVKKVLHSIGAHFRGGAQQAFELEMELSPDTADEFDIIYNSNKSYADFLDRLKDVGFLMADRSNVSISVFDFRRLEVARTNNAIVGVLRKMLYSKCMNGGSPQGIAEVLSEIDFLVEYCAKMSNEGVVDVANPDYLEVLLNDNMHDATSPVRIISNPGLGTMSLGHALICKTIGKKIPCEVSAIAQALMEDSTSGSPEGSDAPQVNVAKTVRVLSQLVDFANKAMIDISPRMGESVRTVAAHTGVSEIEHRRAVLDKKLEEGRLTKERHCWLYIQLIDSSKKLVMNDIESTMQTSRNSNLFLIVDSGARGNMTQLMEVCGIIGTVSDSDGKPISTPVMGNLLKGLDPNEMILNAYASRSMLVDTQLNIPVTGTLNRELSYYTQHLQIRPEEHQPDDFCGAAPIDYPLAWQASIKETKDATCQIYTGFDRMEDDEEWQRFLCSFYNKNPFIKVNPDIMECAKQAGLTHLFVSENSNVLVRNISRVGKSDYVYMGVTVEFIQNVELKKAYGEFVRNYHTRFNSKHLINDTVLHLLTSDFLSEIPVIVKGQFKMAKVEYTLANYCRRTLEYRSAGIEKLDPDIRELVEKYAFRKFVDGEVSVYIVTEDLMDALTRHPRKIRSFPIYTITGCKSSNGICRKCYGLKYDTDMMPAPNELVGFQGVQAVCSTMSQMILDSHKGGSSGKAMDQMNQLVALLDEFYGVEKRMLQELEEVLHVAISAIGVNIDSRTVEVELIRAMESTALPCIIKDTAKYSEILREFLQGNSNKLLESSALSEQSRNIKNINTVLRDPRIAELQLSDDQLEGYLTKLYDVYNFDGVKLRAIKSFAQVVTEAFGNLLGSTRVRALKEMMDTAYIRWFSAFDLTNPEELTELDIRMKFRNQVMSQFFTLIDQRCLEPLKEGLAEVPETVKEIIDTACGTINDTLKFQAIKFRMPECQTFEDLAAAFKDMAVAWFDQEDEDNSKQFQDRLRDVITTADDQTLKVVHSFLSSEVVRLERLGKAITLEELTAKIYQDIERESTPEELGLYLRLSVWFELIKQLDASGIFSRNFEPLSVVLNSVGECMKDFIAEDGTVFALGETYPIKLLNEHSIPYNPVKVNRDIVVEKSGNVFAAMALTHTRDHINRAVTRAAQNLYRDQLSEAISGGYYVTKRPEIDVREADRPVELTSIIDEEDLPYIGTEVHSDIRQVTEIPEVDLYGEDDFLGDAFENVDTDGGAAAKAVKPETADDDGLSTTDVDTDQTSFFTDMVNDITVPAEVVRSRASTGDAGLSGDKGLSKPENPYEVPEDLPDDFSKLLQERSARRNKQSGAQSSVLEALGIGSTKKSNEAEAPKSPTKGMRQDVDAVTEPEGDWFEDNTGVDEDLATPSSMFDAEESEPTEIPETIAEVSEVESAVNEDDEDLSAQYDFFSKEEEDGSAESSDTQKDVGDTDTDILKSLFND